MFRLATTLAEGQRVWARDVGAIGSGGIVSTSFYCASDGTNPSGVAQTERLTVGAGTVVPYGLAELAETRGTVAVPTKLCCVAVRIGTSGGEWSRFTTFGAEIGRQIGKVDIGMGYHGMIHKLRYSDNGKTSYSTIGATYRPNGNLAIGVAIRNIEKRVLTRGERGMRIGTTAWASVVWNAPKIFSIGAEMEKETGRDAAMHVGLALAPGGGLRFTTGFSTTGTELGAGIGYEREKWGIRAGICHHQHLGISGGAALAFHPHWP